MPRLGLVEAIKLRIDILEAIRNCTIPKVNTQVYPVDSKLLKVLINLQHQYHFQCLVFPWYLIIKCAQQKLEKKMENFHK